MTPPLPVNPGSNCQKEIRTVGEADNLKRQGVLLCLELPVIERFRVFGHLPTQPEGMGRPRDCQTALLIVDGGRGILRDAFRVGLLHDSESGLLAPVIVSGGILNEP